MTLEERRQALFAALLRYAPEVGTLRDRVLDRLVLVALFETTQTEPLRVGAIQANIRLGTSNGQLRTEVIQLSLERLIADGKVALTEHRARHCYYLTPKGTTDVSASADTAGALFEPVLAKMLADTETLVARDIGERVCRKFISECFAKFGQQIARTVTGGLTKADLIASIDARSAFAVATAGMTLAPEACESLEARCVRFLRSTDTADEALKFHLTQGYYIAHLLGLESAQFNPIADQAFRGAVFYLDTNVLIPRLLDGERGELFDELVRISTRLGVELRVTRATIDEARAVAEGRCDDLKKVVAMLPQKLIERTRDDILEAFLARRAEKPDLDPCEFLDPFSRIPQLLDEVGIHLEDVDTAAIIDGRDVRRESEIIGEAAKTARGHGKNAAVLLHDVAHYLLVIDARTPDNKAWFLSNDRTLAEAAVDLSNGALPFCLPLVGFIQGISPFVSSPDDQHPLADLFSAALEDGVSPFPGQCLFDLEELRLIGEMHEDVLSTPPEQLVLAFDYVKSTVLRGKPYQVADHGKVTLGLRKFLSSSADERQKSLLQEAARQTGVADNERKRRELAELEAAHAREEAEGLAEQVKKTKREVKRQEFISIETRKREDVWKAAIMFLGALLAIAAWSFEAEFRYVLFEDPGIWNLTLRGIGSLLFLFSSLPTALAQTGRLRTAILTVVSVVSIAGLGVVDVDLATIGSGILAFATPVVLLILALFDKREAPGNGTEEEEQAA